jgi:hypothetical protein
MRGLLGPIGAALAVIMLSPLASLPNYAAVSTDA